LYNELYDLWKIENENERIQRLPRNFYTKVATYIKKLKEENRMLDHKTTKSRLLDNEFKNVRAMVNELFLLRYKKFREDVVDCQTIGRGSLTKEEKKLYGGVLTSAEACQVFSNDILRGNLLCIKKDNKQTFIVLRFVKEIPALVGSDMKTYGPFGLEDIATLPLENARILIKQRVAVEVDSN
jgi:DNA replication initiation complex subunit (GINS family)